MISVIMPTYNAEEKLEASLHALMGGVIDGQIKELIIVDGGSTDLTLKMAEEAGAQIIISPSGRGHQLKAGADAAKGGWLLFLHADTVLAEGWHKEVGAFCHAQNKSEMGAEKAGVFRFALNDRGVRPRLLEHLVALRCWLFALPYGDQGLLISKSLYNQIGGYKQIPLMEDVDIIHRLGRKRLQRFKTKALTAPVRYQREGYGVRILKNLTCLSAYYLGVPPEKIVKFYER